MLEVLTLLFLLSNCLVESVLYLINIKIPEGLMGNIYLVLALFTYFLFVKEVIKTKTISKKMCVALLFLILILLGFAYTATLNGGMTTLSRRYLLYYGSASISMVLLAYLLNLKGNLIRLLRIIPYVVIIITTATTICMLFPSNLTNASQIYDDSGLTYQNMSYYSSLAFALNGYYLFNSKHIEGEHQFKYMKVLLYVLFLPQSAVVILSGGRGGFVLLIIYFVAILLRYFNFNRYSSRSILNFLGILVLLSGLYLVVSNINLESRGLQRMILFLKGGFDNSSRTKLHELAYDAFQQSVLIGNGIGSVFFLVGYASHSIVYDILCEVGVLGAIIVCFIFIKYAVAQKRISATSKIYDFSLIIFLYGAVLSLVSGYYLANHFLFFAITYAILSRGKEKYAANK